MSVDLTIAYDIKPGEYSWEVMEHSATIGEKPIRLVISPESIRTITSLLLLKPAEQKEHWHVPSSRVIKVSWCPELCVFSVLYSKPDDTKEYTKAFFVNRHIGKKIVKRYKKIKPVFVQLSPGRPKNLKKKGYNLENNRKTENPIAYKVSFTLRISEKDEKMWRATFLDNSDVREIFLGISPTALRVVDPISLETEFRVDHLHLVGIKYHTRFPNNNILTIKFFLQYFEKNPKSHSKHFHVLPVTAKEILSYFEECNALSLGEDSKNRINTPLFTSVPDLSQGYSAITHEFPRSQSVPETHEGILSSRTETNIMTGATVSYGPNDAILSYGSTVPYGSTRGPVSTGNFLSKSTGAISSTGKILSSSSTPASVSAGLLYNDRGQKLPKKGRPKSVKLPTRIAGEVKEDPPRSISAKKSLPKSSDRMCNNDGFSNNENRTSNAEIMSRRSKIVATQHCQPLLVYDSNLAQDHRGDCKKSHSRNKNITNAPGGIVCYGKEGGALKKFKEVLEGPKADYQYF